MLDLREGPSSRLAQAEKDLVAKAIGLGNLSKPLRKWASGNCYRIVTYMDSMGQF